MNIETTTAIKTLSHGQQIRVPVFRYVQRIDVCTLRGCFEKDGYGPGKTWEEFEAREKAKAVASGWEHKLAWTYQHPGVLTENYPGKAEEFERRRAETAAAVEIADGEIVSIDGTEYKVKLNGSRYSDPVSFKPITA